MLPSRALMTRRDRRSGFGWWLAAAALCACAAACSGGGNGSGGDDDDDDDDGTTECPRPLAPADRERFGVIARPYEASGDAADLWEIVSLSEAGDVTFTGAQFTMGRNTLGEVVFTPDGEVGIVAQDDGTLGVFTVDETGAPAVVHAAFEGSFYAARVVMDPSGERAWVLDTNFRKNGGGIYSVAIGCDGSLTDEGIAAAGKLPYDMELRSPGLAVVYAKDLLDSAFGHDLHRFTLDPPDVTAGVDAFPDDDDAIVADLAITADANFALVADNNAFGTGNRVAIVDLVPPTPVLVQSTNIEDPISIAVSPFDDAALVASGFGDAVFVLSYDAGAVPPFVLDGELAYTGAGPQLPANFVQVRRGSLDGLVLLAELSGIRRIRFNGAGNVEDLGLTELGSGVENIVGAMGFPP